MGSTMKTRKRYEEFLNKVPLLKDLDKYERNQIADALESVDVKAGQVVFLLLSTCAKIIQAVFCSINYLCRIKVIMKQGDSGTDFFIVLEGTVVITKTNAKGESGELGQLSSGQYFGIYSCSNYIFSS